MAHGNWLNCHPVRISSVASGFSKSSTEILYDSRQNWLRRDSPKHMGSVISKPMCQLWHWQRTTLSLRLLDSNSGRFMWWTWSRHICLEYWMRRSIWYNLKDLWGPRWKGTLYADCYEHFMAWSWQLGFRTRRFMHSWLKLASSDQLPTPVFTLMPNMASTLRFGWTICSFPARTDRILWM